MSGDVGVHRANDGNVINAFTDLWKKLADFDSALSFFLKFKLRWQRHASDFFDLSSCVFRERWLRIPSVDVGWAALAENVYDSLCGACEVASPRTKWGKCRSSACSRRAAGAKKAGETKCAKAHAKPV